MSTTVTLHQLNEPLIIDITSYDDIIRSIDDGRLDKVIDEHTRYMKETDRRIWSLCPLNYHKPHSPG